MQITRSAANWWKRECGGKDVLTIAIPLIVSTMSHSIMQFCDRLFLAWHDATDLAAVMPAGVLTWTTLSLNFGIALYATTFVAQYAGANQPQRISQITWQAIWIGILSTPLFIVIGYFGPEIFSAAGHSAEMAAREADYFWILSLASGATVANAGVSSFWTGRGDTKTVMYVNIFAATLNIVLDYCLIFGVAMLGIQAAGIHGAAIATALSIGAKLGLFLFLFLGKKHRTSYQTHKNILLNRGMMMRLLRFGVPNGFQFFIEGGAITAFVLIVGRISDMAAAATALAFSINMFAFIPIIGLSIGISTLVGQQIGNGKPELAARATWTGLWIGLAYTTCFAAIYLIQPDIFLSLHQAGVGESAEEFRTMRELATFLLAFVAVYCLFDTAQIIFVAAIKGAGDTLFVVSTTILTATTFVVGGNLSTAAIIDPDSQLLIWWYWLTGWVIALSIVYFARFRQGRWKSMSVIEPDLISASPS